MLRSHLVWCFWRQHLSHIAGGRVAVFLPDPGWIYGHFRETNALYPWGTVPCSFVDDFHQFPDRRLSGVSGLQSSGFRGPREGLDPAYESSPVQPLDRAKLLERFVA